uniref:Uncharacterized protein n=1 Tax=Anopheles albimanus TaxID=7167 RepID=A0A182FX59_ANOAL
MRASVWSRASSVGSGGVDPSERIFCLLRRPRARIDKVPLLSIVV